MPEPNAETIKEALQEVKNGGEFPGEFKVGDGTVVKAQNWEEAFKKLADMQANTQTALRDREDQIRQRDELLAQRAEPEVRQPPANGGGFDAKKYWELMNTDPVAGTNYAMAAGLGVEDPSQLPQLFNEIKNVSVYSADQFEIQSFMQRNPDFPGTDEAANQLIETLARENRPLTNENLEYAYLRSVRDGTIEPLGEEAPRNFVPPNLRGTGVSSNEASLLEQVKNVPDDKLDDFYRKIGMLR